MSEAMFECLRKLGRGPRARIREILREDPVQETPWALRYLGNFRLRREEYLVAGLYCAFYPNPDTVPSPRGSFAQCLAMAIHSRDGFDPEKEGSLEKRFLHLLDLQPEEMASTLRSLLAVLGADGFEPNFSKLAGDLRYWNDNTRRRWAREFYDRLHRTDSESKELGKENSDETA